MAAPPLVQLARPLAESPRLTTRELPDRLPAERLRADGEQNRKEEDAEGLAESGNRRPGDQRQPDRGGDTVGGSLTLAEVGRRFSAQRHRRSGPPRQPGTDDGQDAEGDRRDGHGYEQGGADVPAGLHRRLDRGGLRQRAGDAVAGDLTDQEREHPGDDETEADRSHRLTAATPSQVEGAAKEQDQKGGEDDRQFADRLGDLLRGRELLGIEDFQLARVFGQFRDQVPRHSHLFADLLDDGAELKGDFSFAGRDDGAAAVHHRQELLMGASVRLGPDRLYLRGRQGSFGYL